MGKFMPIFDGEDEVERWKNDHLEEIVDGTDNSALAQRLREKWTTNGAYTEIWRPLYDEEVNLFIEKVNASHAAAKNSKIVFKSYKNPQDKYA